MNTIVTEPARLVYLKIKVVSLAAEANLIRREERRWKGGSEQRTGLHQHRVLDVRRESRATLIAYGFLRGIAYETIERGSREAVNWKRVYALVIKYGASGAKDKDLAAWAAVRSVS